MKTIHRSGRHQSTGSWSPRGWRSRLDAVGTYNDAVENATKQLKADAGKILTPAQIAELDRWMEKGINPEVNRILASRAATPR